uniref:Retroviral polymerase SH3-like domain-containing protein n=1 Tax=Strigamia maritima TaxID=126957 RepID=T1INN0_STRMM
MYRDSRNTQIRDNRRNHSRNRSRNQQDHNRQSSVPRPSREAAYFVAGHAYSASDRSNSKAYFGKAGYAGSWMDKAHSHIHIYDSTLTVYEKRMSEAVMIGKLLNGLYYLDGIEVEINNSSASVTKVPTSDSDVTKLIKDESVTVQAIESVNNKLSLTFAYLKNRSPHSSLDFKVPYVKWKQQRLSLRHLKRPSVKCFVHHTATGRGKLEDRAWVGVLVGYAIGTRGYRVWDPATDRVVQTKHVKIDETVIYKHFGRQQEVEFLQTADSSPVMERCDNLAFQNSDITQYRVTIKNADSSTDSDDNCPAPIMTTPEKNLLLTPIPNASSIEDIQSSTSQSSGRLTDALLYLTTPKPILKQSVGSRELDLPQPDTVEPVDHLSEDNEDFEDAESLPTNERKSRVNFPWKLIGGSSIYSHWRREEHLRKDGSGRIHVYCYPASKIQLRSMKDVNAYCTQAGTPFVPIQWSAYYQALLQVLQYIVNTSNYKIELTLCTSERLWAYSDAYSAYSVVG